MKSNMLVIMGLLIGASFNAGAQTADSIKIKEVESSLVATVRLEGDGPWNIQERMKHFHVNALSIAVIHNYNIEWARAYGWADDSLRIPATVETLFQSASISKSLNAIGVLKLVQDKKIDLYADINDYLVSWKFPYDSLSKGKKISMANLLSHTAGLTVHGFDGYRPGEPLPTIEQILDGKKPANSAPVRSMYAPGLKSEYSGGGTTISQLVTMDVTQQAYDKYMYSTVLQPLGMTSSTFEQPPLDKGPNLLATGYRLGGSEVKGKYHVYPEEAPAGLWTNPTDLAKYIIETQLALEGKSHKVLNQQYTRLRLTPYVDQHAALGVFIADFDGTQYFTHSGANEGFRSNYFGSLSGGNGVVVMVNSDNGEIMNEVINSVAKVYGFKGLYQSRTLTHAVVADSVLQRYVGDYELTPTFTLTIIHDNGRLYAQGTGQPRLELIPESQTKFYADIGYLIEIELIKDEKDQISKLILYQHGAHEGKKVK